MAKKWKEQGKLNDIQLLINLDLLGTSDTRFKQFFHHDSHDYYAILRQCERDLRNNGKLYFFFHNNLTYFFRSTERTFFSPEISEEKIEDDFLPFYEQGVKVLHIIPSKNFFIKN